MFVISRRRRPAGKRRRILQTNLHLRSVLELRREAGKSSTAKLRKMRDLAFGGRVRNSLQYHAATTGRWGGRGVQFHNFPRGNLKPHEVEAAIALIESGDVELLSMLYGPPMDVISSCLRGFICAAPGHDLVACDYSNIEGRVLAWLAGEEWKLQAFRDYDNGTGPDLYNLIYSESFRIPVETVTKAQRQIGKVEELAFGFGGGVGAGQSMAKIYGVDVPDATIDEWKNLWRGKHPKTRAFWQNIEKAAIDAVLNPGGIFSAGHKDRPCKFRKVGSFLWCQLPSKRVICYPYPKITVGKFGGDALSFMAVNAVTKKWELTDTYGGSLAENVTQATARDILAHAMPVCEEAGYPIIFHVHDEIVAEVPSHAGTLDEFTTLLTTLPAWAKDLPVTATGWRGNRYRKD